MCIFLAQSCPTFLTSWTVVHQAPLSMNSLGKNIGVGFQLLLQGLFPTQGSNMGLLHYRQTLHLLSHQLYLWDVSSEPHANKNVKTYSRFTKSKEKRIKVWHYPKLSVHSSSCCAEQLSCPGLLKHKRTFLTHHERLIRIFFLSQRILSAGHILPYAKQTVQLYFFNCKSSSCDILVWFYWKTAKW